MLRWQERRLRRLVRFAYRKSPFYRELYDGAGVDINSFELVDLPTVSKRMLMDNFDRVVTRPEITRAGVDAFCEARLKDEVAYGHFLGRYLPIKSSGSTGEKALFVFDKKYFRRMFAAMAAYRPQGFMPTGPLSLRLAALFSPDEFHLATTSFPRLTPLGMKAVFISASADMGRIVESLNAAQPNLVAGFPSLVEALCPEAWAGRLRIHPARICCTGESLSERTRGVIEKTFADCTVYNLYACAEANPIAMQYGPDPYLRVIEDFVILEAVDSQLRAVQTGQASHGCLLTNLHSTVMPIIRYQMSDRVRFLDGQLASESIFKVMDNVGGRRPVMLQMQNGKGEQVLVQPIALVDLLAEDRDVCGIQIRQAKVGEFRVLASLIGGADESAAKSRLLKVLRELLSGRGVPVGDNTIGLEVVQRILPDADSGKVHGFVSELITENNEQPDADWA